MVWLEISGWPPALGPVILNVCTLDFSLAHLAIGSRVFTEKEQKTRILVLFFQSDNCLLKEADIPSQ